MRRYDDPVEVRRGRVPGAPHDGAPEQFLWRGTIWKVRSVLASWVETGAWWASREVDAVLGGTATATLPPSDLLGERHLWRVEAGRGAATAPGGTGGPGGPGGTGSTGVFELSFDHDGGHWSLVGCAD